MLIRVYTDWKANNNSIAEYKWQSQVFSWNNFKSLDIKYSTSNAFELDFTIWEWKLTQIKQKSKIEVLENSKVIFDWYIEKITDIYEKNVWFSQNVVAFSYLQYFLEKELISDLVCVNLPINQVFNDIITQINTENNNLWFNEEWTFFTDFDTLINKTWNAWTQIKSIIDEILKITWWQIKSEKWNIKLLKYLWTDLTNTNKWILILNKKTDKFSKIVWIQRETIDLFNFITWKDWANTYSNYDINSILKYWQILKKTINLNWNWTLADQVNWFLELKKNENYIYSIQINWFLIDYNIWDKIKLSIQNTNNLDFNWNVFVNQITKTFSNWQFYISNIELSEITARKKDLSSYLEDISDKIKVLQNN